MSSKNLVLGTVAAWILATVAVPATADVLYGDNVIGLHTHFWIADESPVNPYIDSISGMSFDPTHTDADGDYDRIYLTNRSTNDDRRGLYSANIATETFSTRLAAIGMDDNPADVVADANGDVYIVWDYTPQVWKISDPSGTPVETQLLGNYGAATTDDDPYCIDLVPAGFGGSFDPGVDLVIFDAGLDNNEQVAIVVLESTSTPGAPAYTIIWSDPDDISMNGRCNPVDGYAYFTQNDVLSATLGAETLPYINRVKSDGVLERVFLDIDSMATEVDNVIAVNPLDGSVWIPIRVTTGTEEHVFYRVDVVNAVDQGGGDFLADVTAEITLDATDGYNVGTNGLAFSPDGKYLAVGAPSGRDSIYVYRLIPEPGTIVLFALGGLGILFLKRRG